MSLHFVDENFKFHLFFSSASDKVFLSTVPSMMMFYFLHVLKVINSINVLRGKIEKIQKLWLSLLSKPSNTSPGMLPENGFQKCLSDEINLTGFT